MPPIFGEAFAEAPDATFALELCCGSAGVSRALISDGWTAAAVDNVVTPMDHKIVCIKVDILNSDFQNEVLEQCEDDRLGYIHMAPCV